MCPFRYVDETTDTSVTLHLFRTINGTPRGDARGPTSGTLTGATMFDAVFCKPVNEAFAAAIRMANRNDTDVVVTGDRHLWNQEWGQLAE